MNLYSWYSTGTKTEKRTFWACFAGWTLDSFDAQMFTFLLPALMATWGIGKGQAGMLGTAALLASAVGGWIAGILSDRLGRVRVLLFTVIWFTAFSVIAGFTHTFGQLLIVRICQGIGFGGEWAVGATLMAEVIRPENRGKAVGLVQSGFSIGWGLASVVTIGILAWFPQAIGWRVALWVSVVPGVIVYLVQRGVKEPDIFVKQLNENKGKPKASFSSVFRKDVRRRTLLASVLILGFQGSSYAIINWLPTLLVQVRHLAPREVVVTMLIMTGGAFFGFLANAYFSDRIGRRPTIMIASLAGWVLTGVYLLVPMSPVLIAIMGFPIGFMVNGVFASIGPYLSELFPTDIRTTCMAFSYNVGKSVGAFAVTLVGFLSSYVTLSQSIEIFCLIGYAFSVIALLMLPETRGNRLDVPDRDDVRTQPVPEHHAEYLPNAKH